MLWLAYHPSLLIKGINSASEVKLAGSLLLVLFIFSPVLILQRVIQIIFSVRLEDYYTQRVTLVVSVLRILSVFFFFGGGRYMLLEYFLCYNALSFISLIYIIRIARKKYNYDFIKLIKSFRFSKPLYHETSQLAVNTFVLSLSWIFFYEMDLLYIGFFLGKEEVAFYAVAFTLLRFFRDMYGTFYYPFVVRFNHFIGLNEAGNLSSMYHTLLKVGISLSTIPIVAFVVLMKPLIYSWVGPTYISSVFLAQVLVFSSISGFISYPAGALFTARVELKKLYLNAVIMPLVFLIGVLATQHQWGIRSYAIFKTVAIFVSTFILFIFTLGYLKITFARFFNIYVKSLILPLLLVVAAGLFIQYQLKPEKGLFSLIVTGVCIGVLNIIGFSMYYLRDTFFRKFIKDTVLRLMNKNAE
jgi:O-antigen/teichoic acid export membrane protein